MTENPDWPKFKIGEVIGMSGQISDDLDGYEELGRIRGSEFVSPDLSDELFGKDKGYAARVLGRVDGFYIVGMRHRGDPIIKVPATEIEAAGFNPNKFSWKPFEFEDEA